jgi:hypothetical protein
MVQQHAKADRDQIGDRLQSIRESGLRRPERFGGSYRSTDPADVQARAATGMSPDLVGERVVHAIRNDEFFVFTHPEGRTRVEQRHARIIAAFDTAAQYFTARK